jgi:hypothetical protein
MLGIIHEAGSHRDEREAVGVRGEVMNRVVFAVGRRAGTCGTWEAAARGYGCATGSEEV